jgi:hypothetical protein
MPHLTFHNFVKYDNDNVQIKENVFHENTNNSRSEF